MIIIVIFRDQIGGGIFVKFLKSNAIRIRKGVYPLSERFLSFDNQHTTVECHFSEPFTHLSP